MTASRLAGAAAVALAMLVTAACAGEDEPTSTTSTSATAADTPSDDLVTWAGGVCTGVDGLRVTLQELVAVVPVDQATDQAVPDQVGTEVEQRVAAVREDVESLGTAVRALPPEADPDLAAVKDDLATVSTQLETQVGTLSTAAEAVAAATTPEAVEAALPALRSSVLSVGTAIAAYASEVSRLLGSADPSVRGAFSAAPSCQQIPGTGTPSPSG